MDENTCFEHPLFDQMVLNTEYSWDGIFEFDLFGKTRVIKISAYNSPDAIYLTPGQNKSISSFVKLLPKISDLLEDKLQRYCKKLVREGRAPEGAVADARLLDAGKFVFRSAPQNNPVWGFSTAGAWEVHEPVGIAIVFKGEKYVRSGPGDMLT